MIELFCSRVAAEIDLLEDAYMVRAGSSYGTVIHLAPLGLMHSICFGEGERSVISSRDFSHLLYKYLRSETIYTPGKSNILTEGDNPDEIVRNRQVEVFISLVLDVKQSGASSLELAAPALHALQMSLQSQWQPTNIFTSAFLNVLVSLLNPTECEEHDIHSKYKIRSNSGSSSSSTSAIAEDLISIILRKLPWNSDLMLDVLFSSLKCDTLQVYTTAQISILSQALGTYFKTSLPYTITKHVIERSLSRKHELVGITRNKADNLWRSTLILGDALELAINVENPSVSSSALPLSQWVTATIVKIDYRSNTLTLEYRSPLENSLFNSDHVQHDEKPLHLLEIPRINGPIRQVGSKNTSSSSSSFSPTSSFSHSSINSFTSHTTNKIEIEGKADTEIETETELEVKYLVKKNHQLNIDLIFKSMKRGLKWKGFDGSNNNSNLNNKMKKVYTLPNCSNGHNMSVTSLFYISRKLKQTNGCVLRCYKCNKISQNKTIIESRCWYCDLCNHQLCFSCETFEKEATQFLYLQGPKGETLDLHPMESKYYENSSHSVDSDNRTFSNGDVIEVNAPINNNINNKNGQIKIGNCNIDGGNKNDYSKSDGVIGFGLYDSDNFYRLVDGSGFVRRVFEGWSWSTLTDETNNNYEKISSCDIIHDCQSYSLPTMSQFPSSSCTSPEARTPTTPISENSKNNLKIPRALSCENNIIPLIILNQKDLSPPIKDEINYNLANLVELSRKLDKCRKKEILNSSRDNLSSEKEATGVVDTASILTELLTCALAVFGKVNIIMFSLL